MVGLVGLVHPDAPKLISNFRVDGDAALLGASFKSFEIQSKKLAYFMGIDYQSGLFKLVNNKAVNIIDFKMNALFSICQ